jgi:hypothetical protein
MKYCGGDRRAKGNCPFARRLPEYDGFFLLLEIVFSTAHKAKGLEFDTVRIGEDFLSDYPVGELGKLSLWAVSINFTYTCFRLEENSIIEKKRTDDTQFTTTVDTRLLLKPAQTSGYLR